MIDNTVVASATVSLIIVAGYYYVRNKYSYWEKRGVKSPMGIPFLGHMPILFSRFRSTFDKYCLEKFGLVYGIYYGFEPHLVIADAELMQLISIKKFDSFVDHQVVEFMNRHMKLFVFSSTGDDWRRIRAIMSPTFTSGKLKKMYKSIGICCEDMLNLIEEHKSKDGRISFDVQDMFKIYALSSICNACYSFKVIRNGEKCYNKLVKKDEFLRDLVNMLKINFNKMAFILSLPKSIVRYFNMKVISDSAIEPGFEKMRKMVKLRRSSSSDRKFDDYLQLLVDSELEKQDDNNEKDNIVLENHHACLNDKQSKETQKMLIENQLDKKHSKKLTDDEIIMNASLLISVGVHTTSALLTNTTYFLAHHPEIQDRLYEEVYSIMVMDESSGESQFDYNTLSELKYLDAVLSESMRLIPPASQTDRVTLEDFYLEKYKILIPKGSFLMLSINMLHKNPIYWQDPNKFDPDRFMADKKEQIVPGSYAPFGIGPRHCVGMRLSLMESKLALARILIKYTLRPANPNYSTNFNFNSGVTAQVHDSRIVFLPRIRVNLS